MKEPSVKAEACEGCTFEGILGVLDLILHTFEGILGVLDLILHTFERIFGFLELILHTFEGKTFMKEPSYLRRNLHKNHSFIGHLLYSV